MHGPLSRNLGARRVVNDGYLAPRHQALKARVQGLEDLLSSGLKAFSNKEMAESELLEVNEQPSQANNTFEEKFADRTGDVIGPRREQLDPQGQARCSQITADLLGHARDILRHDGEDAAIRDMFRRWDKWQGGGRRHISKLDREVLDVLSYECRAAFYQVYSAAWSDFIQLFGHIKQYSWNEQAAQFHHFFHCQLRQPGPDSDGQSFFLFHGHIFALHPAIGPFMLTQTGTRLMEAFILNPSHVIPWRNLLRGLYLSIWQYFSDRFEAKQERKSRPQKKRKNPRRGKKSSSEPDEQNQ